MSRRASLLALVALLVVAAFAQNLRTPTHVPNSAHKSEAKADLPAPHYSNSKPKEKSAKPRKIDQPKHFPKPRYDFKANPFSDAKVELGRMLFYDPVLSADSSVSCASCHSPYNAFAHTDHALSHGIHDSIGRRNAPALFNLAWQPSFMWDGAIANLDMQALAPLQHPGEMAQDLPQLVAALAHSQRYRLACAEAFGDSLMTGQRLLQALALFEVTLVSASSKYDSVMLGKATFDSMQAKGYALYQQHCARCHAEPLFTNHQFANNGLPPDPSLQDWGRMRITGRSADSLLFKVPSLRNLSYSYPYMHDGRFKRIRQVLDHYAAGVSPSATLDAGLRGGIPLTSEQKVELSAFLLTLDDRAFVFDPTLQFPHDRLR